MDRIEREVQEERFLLMSLDKRDRLTSKGIGQVGRLGRCLCPPQDPITRFREIGMAATEKSEVFIEAPFLGMKFGACPKMPFSDQSGDIPCILETIGNRRFGKR